MYTPRRSVHRRVTPERTAYEEIARFPDSGEVIEVTGTVEFTDDYEFRFETEQIGSFTLSPSRHPPRGDDRRGPVRPAPVPATFRLEGQARYVVETVRNGRVFVPREMIRDAEQDIDKVRIRNHIFELKDGRRVVGKIPQLSDGTITVRKDLRSEPVTFSVDDIADARTANWPTPRRT